MIKWPAIINFVGDAELTHIDSEVDWDRGPQLHAAHYLPGDRLIDSNGIEYTLGEHVHGSVVPRPTGKVLSLDEVVQLIRIHAAQDGACCVSKISAPSVADAIAMLK